MNKLIAPLVVLCIFYFGFVYDGNLETLKQPLIEEANYQSGLKVVKAEHPDQVAEYGMYTVVEFYTDRCSACRYLKGYYDQFLPLRPDVSVRRIELPANWNSATASAQYNLDIQSTPHVLIYDQYGQLLVEDEGDNKDAYEVLWKWIEYTLQENS